MNAGSRSGRLYSLLHNCTISSYTDDRSSTVSHFRRMVSCGIRSSINTIFLLRICRIKITDPHVTALIRITGDGFNDTLKYIRTSN